MKNKTLLLSLLFLSLLSFFFNQIKSVPQTTKNIKTNEIFDAIFNTSDILFLDENISITNEFFGKNNILNSSNSSLKHIKKINQIYFDYLKNITDKSIDIIENQILSKIKKNLRFLTFGEENFEEDFHYLNEFSENNIKYDESLQHRLIPETFFEFNNKITCFNLISTKEITKDDTGHFVSVLLLICQNNSIIVSDLLGNKYFIYNTSYEINEIITYNQNDINDFYIITKNYTEIRKFILLQGLFYKNNTNFNETIIKAENKIDVDTYAQDIKREKIEKLSYELVDIYKLNIKEERVKIFEEKEKFFNLNDNNYSNSINDKEYIISSNPVIIKGVKYLIIITNKKSIYKLNNENLDIISYSEIKKNNTGNYSDVLSPITMTSYYILFNKQQNGFIISKMDNISYIIAMCELFPSNSTEKIKFYFFDQKSRTLYILSNLYNIYLVTPMLVQTSQDSFKNSCRIIFICKLGIIVENTKNFSDYGTFYLSLLNKKLMITNDGINFEVIDLTKIGEVDNENKLQTKYFSLNQFIHNKTDFTPLISKNNNKYILLYKISNNSIILFNFHEKNSKIYTSEPQSFNFKVPIILVAFIIILVWNYIKKKNENNGIEEGDFKNNINLYNEEEKKIK